MSSLFPLCFTSREQYENWLEVARVIRPGSIDHCTDCTPEYQAKMKAAGRCEYPGTTFAPGKDGFVEGTRPIAMETA